MTQLWSYLFKLWALWIVSGGRLFCWAATHWVMTEDGLIKPKPNSEFNMRRPYDLTSLLQQEARFEQTIQFQQTFSSKQTDVDVKEVNSEEIERKLYETDRDCIAAGKPLAEFDLFISTMLPLENKGIRVEDYIGQRVYENICPSDSPCPESYPYCTKFIDLQYSIYAFEHLEAMKDRRTLVGYPELGLRNAITSICDDVHEYGRRVAAALRKNVTSWILYNMATFYWRIQGNAFEAVECARRALQFSPQQYRDVALVNLGNILHRASYSSEASIVISAAVEISGHLNVNHFTLGNIYAVLHDYSKSSQCFENTLKLQPNFEAAILRRFAVLCHMKLQNKLDHERKILEKTLVDLKDFQSQYTTYQQLKDKFDLEQVTPELREIQEQAYKNAKLFRKQLKAANYCEVVDGNTKASPTCTPLSQSPPKEKQHPTIEKPLTLSQEDSIFQETIDFTKLSQPTKPHVYPKVLIDSRDEVFDESVDWPSKENCDQVTNPSKGHPLPDVYLPPENKGFDLRPWLTFAQNLEIGMQHQLPWYPPVCGSLSGIKDYRKVYGHLKSLVITSRGKIDKKPPNESIRQYMMSILNEEGVTEEEVGQRILTAIKITKGQNWLVYIMASMYWKVRGHMQNSVDCLQHSLLRCPQKYLDVPLVNLASILYQLGHYIDAEVLLNDAIKVCSVEPVTHLLYGNTLWATKNRTGAFWHYAKAAEYEPSMDDAKNNMVAVKCEKKFQIKTDIADEKKSEGCDVKYENGRIEQKHKKSDSGKCGAQVNSGNQCSEKCDCCSKTNNYKDSPDGTVSEDSCNSCANKPSNSCPGMEETLYTTEFLGSLDDLAEFYEKRGMCHGEDCQHLNVARVSGQKSHVKLYLVDGQLQQKVILASSPHDIKVTDDECMIYSDGSRSSGCEYPVFKKYMENLLVISAKRLMTIPQSESRHVIINPSDPDSDGLMVQVSSDNVQVITYKDKDENGQIFNAHPIPDVRRHVIGSGKLPPTPALPECIQLSTMKFKYYSSTWLPLSQKGININDHIDFKKKVYKPYLEPFCIPPVTFDGDITDYPGLMHPNELQYLADSNIAKMFPSLAKDLSTESIAMRIALTLQKNATSWVAASLATLYWMMQGNVKEAINCIKVSLNYAPIDKKDVALVSLANILGNTGHSLNDAIYIMDKALDASNEPAISHYTMANFFLVKGDRDTALLFYHSALQRDSTMKTARRALMLIQCSKNMKFT